MKPERRRYYRTLQSSFSTEQYRAWNLRLAEQLHLFTGEIPPGSLVAVYSAKEKEADPSALLSLPFRFCYPRVLSRKGEMEFRAVKAAGDLKPGAFGILEPAATHPLVHREEIHTCFVPLLAFDGEGNRLGQGLGFYDRYLAGFEGQRVGVAFEWQFSPKPLPTEPNDVQLHALATEQTIRRF